MINIAALSFLVSLYSATTRAALINSYGMLFFVVAGVPAILGFMMGLISNLSIAFHFETELKQMEAFLFQNEWVTSIGGIIPFSHPLALFYLINLHTMGLSLPFHLGSGTAFTAFIAIQLTLATGMVIWSIARLRASYHFAASEVSKPAKIKEQVNKSTVHPWRRPVSERWPLYSKGTAQAADFANSESWRGSSSYWDSCCSMVQSGKRSTPPLAENKWQIG